MSTLTISQPVSATSVAALGSNTQTRLLLHKAGQPYQLSHREKIPDFGPGELLVQVGAIGLNPIDWKSAAYGFALPSLPSVNGREFIGKVVEVNKKQHSTYAVGDMGTDRVKILSVSTDYRDLRKSAFQEYAVVSEFNAVKLPRSLHGYHAASVGVAFVTAAIALGVSLGMVFPTDANGSALNLLKVAQAQEPSNVPADISDEIFNAIHPRSRPRNGDWIMIYGASSVTAQVAIQLSKWSGLKLGVDILIDRMDLDRAADEIKKKIEAPICFALDTVGSDTASWCQKVLASCRGSVLESSEKDQGRDGRSLSVDEDQSHLICLTSRPKTKDANVRVHAVPIKLFHENHDIGKLISKWLEELLASGKLKLPDNVLVNGGLNAVGPSLERMRKGEVSGKRLVVLMHPIERA
ncbi:hypothetical protein ACEQ8H_002067 [Pleosporales sp. CAS-2024a]